MQISENQSTQIVDYLIKAVDKANEVAPAIIQDYLHYKILDLVFGIVFSVTIIVLLRSTTKKVSSLAEKNVHFDEAAVGLYNVVKYIVYFFCILFIFQNILSILGCWLYPNAILLKEVLNKIS